ncbi:hypothetical protein SS49_09270 [Enterobacter hormaechei subsp. steigerwaltii]|uniref:hypothetical protein n=1 Tax=Enterobacter hormaechei TaxID=158836 RepID=UPI0005EEF1CC|nr:hypothetical protein [Enterobacter hormaechei]ELC6385157.1 hypothetical protein [Enterobacter hormaechei]KJN67120.1 hypothetical protein SS49_09270 [Enterobacter hormaechei subsp. steigerwaltii]
MSENKKWKEKLISSSFPLEYIVSRKLASFGIAVSNDFSYSRNDAGILKDFSIDIQGNYWDEECTYHLNFLIECKQRHDNNKWLFMRDPNTPDFSALTLGYTLRAIDNFTRIDLPANATIALDEDMAYAVKGVEIDTSNGNVYDSEIKHGISQLAYSLPDVIIKNIAGCINSHPEDNLPFFIVPILVTTSELYLTRDEFSTENIRGAQDLSDIADLVPYLVIENQHTPGFGMHRVQRFSSFKYFLESEQLHIINDIRKKHENPPFLLPEQRLLDLIHQPHLPFNEYFSQIIVCSLQNLEPLIDKIIEIANDALLKSKKLS